MPLKRRQFLKDLGLGSFVIWNAASLTAATPQSADTPRLPANRAQAGNRRFTHRKQQADILVAGGGLAGICAALAAARNGASVILVQNRSRLGGNSSSEIRMHALGANSSQALRLWREAGIIEELKLTDAATNPQRSFEMWDLMLYDKIVSEPNIQLMLDTVVVDARVRGNRVTRAMAICPLIEETYELEARFFLDCTGDATLAAVSGADYLWGREGRGVFDESLAPPQGDRKTMGNTLLFFSRKHDRSMRFQAPVWARKFTQADFKQRPIRSWEYGYWWIEWGGDLDTIKDNQKIRHELLRCVLGIWDYIKNSGAYAAAANWALEWVGMIPGKRESRRIKGEHVLVQQDLMEARRFDDRVAYGGWPIDDHPPGGIDRAEIAPTNYLYFQQPYSVPLRSLYSVNRPNLLMAGRNISASHVAFASTRVMATGATFGQAAGTTAAFCLNTRCLPRDVVRSPTLLRQLQQLLLKDDQSLLHIRNEDPLDGARSAHVKASAETKNGPAAQIIDGWNRDCGDGSSHQWQAPIGTEAPWIELRWDQPQTIRRLQLTFDSGLHRRLYLSGQDNEYLIQTRGPQPETVADFIIQAEVNGYFKRIAAIHDNCLRLVRVNLVNVNTRAIRVLITRTNGDALARIFEIRAYA
jgi:hypothetical protein